MYSYLYYCRHPDQVYVFFSIESPAFIKGYDSQFINEFDGVPSNFINWTMMYTTDADVFYPYMRKEYAEYLSRPLTQDDIEAIVASKESVAVSYMFLSITRPY